MPDSPDYASLSKAAQVSRVRKLGRNALKAFGIQPDSMRLLVHAENTTFKVVAPQGEFNLRVQRPGYQTAESTASELEFLEYLRGKGLPVPEPVHALDGRLIVGAEAAGLEEPRNCELFRWIRGRFYKRSYNAVHTRRTGRLMAQLHDAALEFRPSKSFARRYLDERGLYLPEDDARLFESPFMNKERRQVLGKIIEDGRAEMINLGRTSDVFGLIHADLHAGNVVWRQGQPQAIDFDDVGWGHYLYDFAAAIAFALGLERYSALRDALLEGYEEVRTLPPHTRELLNVFIRLRYFELVRWVASRQDNPYFRENGEQLISRWIDRIAKL